MADAERGKTDGPTAMRDRRGPEQHAGDSFAAELAPMTRLGIDPRGGWAFLFDIDGTLLDLADHPDRVVVPETLLPALKRLKGLAGGALALVTGRGLGSADRLFGADFDCAGNHGATLRLGATLDAVAAADVPLLEGLSAALEPAIAAHPGAWIERKSHSIAVHWRRVPEAAADLARAVRTAVAGHVRDWRLIEGKGVIEIARRDATKGTAVERLLASPGYVGRRPFYAGDDVTDEDAFQTVAGLGGVGVLVGPPRRTYAHYSCPAPEAFRRWIEALVKDA